MADYIIEASHIGRRLKTFEEIMRIQIKLSMLAMLLLLMPGCTKSCGKEQPVSEGGVYFENIKDGDKVVSPFEVKFGLKGKTVRPAMEDLNEKSSGHHHILIDNPKGYVEEGQVVPTDDSHIHYGKGETSAMIALPPGKHTLTLQFADGAHRSYGKAWASTITVFVEGSEKEPEAENKGNEPAKDNGGQE
jgi:hypothetical protein